MPIESLSRLVRRLGYEFNNPQLLQVALTHRSFSGQSGSERSSDVKGSNVKTSYTNGNYERLEFLGDSIVNFVIADALYHQFPNASEGQLSRLRAKLVQGKALAEISREFDLGNYLQMGTGELKSGGFRRDSILADVFEAIVGAIYEDSGFDTCRERILYWYQSRLGKLSLDDTGKDPKSVLQEFLQSRKIPLPEYKVIDIVGLSHDQVFTVLCSIEYGELVSQGQGVSRRKAEQIAAKDMMVKLLDLLSTEKLSKEQPPKGKRRGKQTSGNGGVNSNDQ